MPEHNISERLARTVRTIVKEYNREDLENWLFLYDAEGKMIATFRRIKFTVTDVRRAVSLADRIAKVYTIGVIHGRQLSTHQIRASFFETDSNERTGIVVRHGTDEIIWTDLTRKDVELLEKSSQPRGG